MVPRQHTGDRDKPLPVRRLPLPLAPAVTLAAVLLSACAQAAPAASPPPRRPPVWVTSAAQPMSIVRPEPARDETCRQILRSTSAGGRIRIRLSNVTSPSALTLTSVTVGPRTTNAAVTDTRPVTLRGQQRIEIPPGGFVMTDSVALAVSVDDDVAISFAVTADATLSAHLVGAATGWCTGPGSGDHSADTRATAFRYPSRLGLVVEALEVLGTRGILAIGDSLTDPPLPPDTYQRWSDVLAASTSRPVANVGIGGNRVLLPGGYGATLRDRFDRDVLSRPGATTAVLFAGTNDVSAGATAAALQEQLTSMCRQLRNAGKRVVIVTLAPAHKRTADKERVRLALNAWIRATNDADAHVDADALLRDPARPTHLLPAYDLGDGLHLSAAGHRALGLAIAKQI